MNKPFSPAADRNKEAILKELKRELLDDQLVLEIASGTGQHACFFSENLPRVTWQPTELKQNIAAIKIRAREKNLSNLLDPLELDINSLRWPNLKADACYLCNTFHIVGIHSVRATFAGCKQLLQARGKFCVYGPFSFHGEHTAPSNEQFDHHLRASDPASGVRDLVELDQMAQETGFSPCRYIKMPANNLFVVWECSD